MEERKEQISLTPEQQSILNEKKVSIRIENEKYLRSKPELKQMTSLYLSQLFEQKPEDPLSFAGTFFCNRNLRERVAAAAAEGKI